MSDPQSPVRVPGLGAPKEPLLVVGTITGAVTAVVALLVAFGLQLSDGQVTAIIGVIAALAPLVTALLARGRVYSPATVRKLLLRQR